MAKLHKFKPVKTYASPKNAIAAVKNIFGNDPDDGLLYFIQADEETGRYFPVFVGQEALARGVHFHFHVIA